MPAGLYLRWGQTMEDTDLVSAVCEWLQCPCSCHRIKDALEDTQRLMIRRYSMLEPIYCYV